MRGKKWEREKIGEVIGKIKELGLSYREGARRYGIPVRTLYDYSRRLNKESLKESIGVAKQAEDEISKGIGSLPEELQELIVEYRRTNPDHGFKRIQDELRSKHLVMVTRKQIREILKRNGLLEQHDSSFDRKKEPAKGSRRFEAKYPGQLYQMDVTYVYITGIPVLYLIVIIDDYSRFCIGAELCRDQRGTTLIEAVHNGSVNYGKPAKLLTDQGRGFYTWSMERTLFQKYLDDMEIEHIVCEPHSPETQGKVERVIQTIKRELLEKVRFSSYEEAREGIRAYIKSYNYERPHQGINGSRPSDRFYGVVGETARIESQLCGKSLELSKGYLTLQRHFHIFALVSFRAQRGILSGCRCVAKISRYARNDTLEGNVVVGLIMLLHP